MLKGSILDVYPDNKKNVMVTWLAGNGRPVKIEEKYQPSFYVYSKTENIYTLASLLRDLPQIDRQNFTTKKLTLGSEKKKFVLEVFPKKLKDFRKVSEMIDSWGGYYRYQLYDVDLRLSTRYLQDRGVFCNAEVRWDGKQFFCDEDQWNIDFEIPAYTKTKLSIQRKTKSLSLIHI